MISKWAISNFKAISDTRVISEDGDGFEEELTFKPLTIFCGANSSGKSSLLQSILLVAQTMRHRNKELPLLLNSEFVSLGTFDDIKSKISNSEAIRIQFAYKSPKLYDFYLDNPECIDDEPEQITGASFSFDFSSAKNKFMPELSNFELSLDSEYEKGIFKYFSNEPRKYLNSISLYIQECPSLMEINNIPLSEKHDWDHLVPKNIGINGMDAIAKLLTHRICTGAKMEGSPLYYVYPEKMREELYEIGLDFYYDGKITQGLFSYFKDDLLSGIQGIDSLFELDGFKFTHYSQGYPFVSLIKKIWELPAPIQEEVKDKIYSNLDKIYDAIKNELSNIKTLLSKSKEKPSDWPENNYTYHKNGAINNETLDFNDAKYICNLIFDCDYIISEEIEGFFSEISNYFASKISYLGPLRKDPAFLYPFSDLTYTREIGKKGENTASILAQEKERKEMFPIPPREDAEIFIKEEKTLKDSVVEWARYIGVADEIEAGIEKAGFSLEVKTRGADCLCHLTNVGVGVSQVLPILVMCLSAEEGSTLIIEQPELHLHPKMQTRLTDFFVAISQSGRQCIIETHSEHIINALRYRIARTENPDDEKLANSVQIYFVEKDKEGSLFKSITMDKYAYISDWPDGFFDESQKSNIKTLKAINNKLEKDPPDE